MFFFLKKFRTSIRANKIATNFTLWLCLIVSQAIHKIWILHNQNHTSELIFSDFFIDWKTATALFLTCFIVFFIITKINKNNIPDQLNGQQLIEGEIASSAMNLGGALLLTSSSIVLTKNDYQSAIYYAIAGLVIYVISWLLLPD